MVEILRMYLEKHWGLAFPTDLEDGEQGFQAIEIINEGIPAAAHALVVEKGRQICEDYLVGIAQPLFPEEKRVIATQVPAAWVSDGFIPRDQTAKVLDALWARFAQSVLDQRSDFDDDVGALLTELTAVWSETQNHHHEQHHLAEIEAEISQIRVRVAELWRLCDPETLQALTASPMLADKLKIAAISPTDLINPDHSVGVQLLKEILNDKLVLSIVIAGIKPAYEAQIRRLPRQQRSQAPSAERLFQQFQVHLQKFAALMAERDKLVPKSPPQSEPDFDWSKFEGFEVHNVARVLITEVANTQPTITEKAQAVLEKVDAVMTRYARNYRGEKRLNSTVLAQQLAVIMLERWQWIIEAGEWSQATQIMNVYFPKPNSKTLDTAP